MSILKFLALLSIFMLISSQTTTTTTGTTDTTTPLPPGTYSDNAPTQCALTANAQARVGNSTCFAELQNIIACFPPQEQDVWAQANLQNTNSTLCFDCSYVQGQIKNAHKNHTNTLGEKMGKSQKNKRAAIACFKSFAKNNLASGEQSSIDKSINTILSNQMSGGQSAAQLLLNVENVFINRRRILCVPTAIRNAMVNSRDSSGNILDFKYNEDEAAKVVEAFLSFFQAKTADMAAMANEISTMTDVVANSANCITTNETTTPTARILQTSGTTTTTTTTGGTTPPPTGTQPPPTNTTSLLNITNLAGALTNITGLNMSGMIQTLTGNGTAPPRPKGKAIGADIPTYVNDITTNANALNKAGATDLVSRIQTSYGTPTTTTTTTTSATPTPLNCQPGGLEKIVGNINPNSTTFYKDLVKFLNPSGKCNATVIYYVQNGQITCEGNCGTFTSQNIAFKDTTKVPSTYYFAVGCAGRSKFVYGTWSDLTTPSTIYTTFRYYGDKNANFNFDQRCLSKAAGCIPGGPQTGGNSLDGACGTKMMKSACQTDLNDKCGKAGLANVTYVPTATYPAACDFVAQEVSSTDSEFVKKCFTWIAKTFFKRSMTFSPEALNNDSAIATAASATTTPALRFLQDSSVGIVATTNDPSASTTTFSSVTLSSSDVVVDGSTPTAAASTTTALADVNSASGAQYMKMSVFVLLLGLLL
jgi:hypothetical protein